MAFLKGQLTSSGRIAIKYGLDFTKASTWLNGAMELVFDNGATLGSRTPTTAGLVLTDNFVAENDKIFEIDAIPTNLTKGARQGAIAVSVNRESGYAMTGWDGNPDCGLKMQIYNRAVNTTARGAVRGFDVLARNRSSGSCSWINGGLITAEHSDGNVANIIGLEVHAKNNGVCSGDVKCLRVFDNSQSATGTSYALTIDCTNNSPFTREYCVHINSGASSGWTNGITFDGNITNTFDFADTNGTNGFTAVSNGSANGNVDGYIQIDAGGATLYLLAYDAVPS